MILMRSVVITGANARNVWERHLAVIDRRKRRVMRKKMRRYLRHTLQAVVRLTFVGYYSTEAWRIE